MAKDNGYIGKISHTGVQHVKAPNAPKDSKGKGTVKTGTDLRSGKK